MSDINKQLERLLRNAATAPRRAGVAEVPFPVQARVLATWRSSRAERGELEGLIHWFRLGLACASAVAVLAIGVSWHGVQSEPADEIAISDATLDVAMLR